MNVGGPPIAWRSRDGGRARSSRCRSPAITKNRRYEAYYDALQDERIREAAERPSPIVLPMQAFGPQPLERAPEPIPVRVWISWTSGPATLVDAFATRWNDRVVTVQWYAPGGQRTVTVWRSAVRHRRT